MWEMVWLIVFMALFIAGAYFLTRFVNKKTRRGHDANMKILDRLPVARDKSILLIQVAQRYFVVGMAAQGMTLLAELSPEEAAPQQVVQSFQDDTEQEHKQPPTFSQFLSGVIAAGFKKPPQVRPEDIAGETVEDRIDRMEDLMQKRKARFGKRPPQEREGE